MFMLKFHNELYKKMMIYTHITEYLNVALELQKNEDIFNNCIVNIKKTWSMINDILHKNKQKTEFPLYFKQAKKTISDKKDVANNLNEFFSQA